MPVCPAGCTTTVEREFRTAPGIRSVAAGIDRNLEALAKDYNLSDLKNNAGSVMESLRRSPTSQPLWGELPRVGQGESGNAVGGILSALHAPPTNAVGDVKAALNLTAPRPNIVAEDKRRLTVVKDGDGNVRDVGVEG